MSNLINNIEASYRNGFNIEDEQLDVYENWETYVDDMIDEAGWLGPMQTVKYLLDSTSFPTDADVADMGCGPGTSGIMLKGAGYTQVDGYDICRHFLAKAKPFYRDVQYLDITLDPIDKYYDVILASGLFDYGHLDAIAVEHLADSLKPNGILIITVPNNNYMKDAGWDIQQHLTLIDTIGPWDSMTVNNKKYSHMVQVFRNYKT